MRGEGVASAQDEAELSRVQTWFAARGRWARRGLALLAGGAATLAHAPFQFTPAYAVALIALVWLLDAAGRGPKPIAAGFGTGFWFGLGHFLTGLYWVSAAFMVDSSAWGPIWGAPAALALGAGMALFWAVGCAVAMAFWTRDVRRIFAFAAALAAIEWVRGHVFGGFPWLLPAYVWMPGEPVSQLASVVGAYGLSTVTLLTFAAPAAVADGGGGAGYRFAPLVVAGLILGMIWGWGEQRLAGAAISLPGANPIVRVADSGLSQAEKWRGRPDQEWRVLARYLDASGTPEESRAQVVVWPEGAIPVVNFFLLENPEFLQGVGRGMGDRALVIGLTRREMHNGELEYYNSAAIIDGVAGAPRVSGQVYDKSRLVPFGEFIPLWSLVSRLNIAPLQRIGAGFTAGSPPTRLIIPEAPPAAVLICYEAIFPGLVPRGDERPGWIINVTNDAWFGSGSGPYQHYIASRYRAIEEGLPMARAASGGISAIIDSYGRAVRETRRTGGYAEAQLPPSLAATLYAYWHWVLSPALIALIAALRFAPLGLPAKGLK